MFDHPRGTHAGNTMLRVGDALVVTAPNYWGDTGFGTFLLSLDVQTLELESTLEHVDFFLQHAEMPLARSPFELERPSLVVGDYAWRQGLGLVFGLTLPFPTDSTVESVTDWSVQGLDHQTGLGASVMSGRYLSPDDLSLALARAGAPETHFYFDKTPRSSPIRPEEASRVIESVDQYVIGPWDSDGNGIDEMVGCQSMLDFRIVVWDVPAGAIAGSWRAPEGEHSCPHSVTGSEDLTGDGIPDLVFPLDVHADPALRAGRVYVTSTAPGDGDDPDTTIPLQIHGADLGDGVGVELATGDVNGDGHADLAVAGGMPQSARPGFVRLFLGPLEERVYQLDEADAVVWGHRVGDLFARELLLTDVDGDGKDDLIVSAMGEPPAGRIYLIDADTWLASTP